MGTLKTKSSAFTEGAWIPERCTVREDDLFPDLEIEGIDPSAKSIAIALDGTSHPIFPNYNHWVTRNLPVQTVIPEGIPRGGTTASFGGVMQGIAYGRSRHRGSEPPLQFIHTYIFTVSVLDCQIDLASDSRRQDLFREMEGHIL